MVNSRPLTQFFLEPLERKADHVRVGTGNPFNDQVSVLLNGVRAGFIQRIHPGQVPPDFHSIQGMESNRCCFRKDFLPVQSQVEQADRRHDHMSMSLQLFQHLVSMLQGFWLAENGPIQAHDRIGPEHQRVRKSFCHRPSLTVGIDL